MPAGAAAIIGAGGALNVTCRAHSARSARIRSHASRLSGKAITCNPPWSARPVTCSSAVYPAPSGIATNWRMDPFSTT